MGDVKVVEGEVIGDDLLPKEQKRQLGSGYEEGEVIPQEEYDQLKDKGKSLGASSAVLVYTPEGRLAVDRLLKTTKKKIKTISPGGLFGKREPNDDQVLYEIDSGLVTSGDREFNTERLKLKRARLIVNGFDPVLQEDFSNERGFAREVFAKGIRDGWQEILDQSPFKDESVKPSYLVKSEPRIDFNPGRKVK